MRFRVDFRKRLAAAHDRDGTRRLHRKLYAALHPDKPKNSYRYVHLAASRTGDCQSGTATSHRQPGEGGWHGDAFERCRAGISGSETGLDLARTTDISQPQTVARWAAGNCVPPLSADRCLTHRDAHRRVPSALALEVSASAVVGQLGGRLGSPGPRSSAWNHFPNECHR